MRHFVSLLWVGDLYFLASPFISRTREPLPEPSGDPGLKEFAAQFPDQPRIFFTTAPVTRECWNPEGTMTVTRGSQSASQETEPLSSLFSFLTSLTILSHFF